ncbi:MAG TPA: hypothetical protein VFY90_12585 [Tepidiformaceae bacterium]|nr:hypothetical protein [Tepidiformaceae bacterium]
MGRPSTWLVAVATLLLWGFAASNLRVPASRAQAPTSGPSQLQFIAEPASVLADRPFPIAPVVEIQDSEGNPTASAVHPTTITVAVVSGPGNLSCTGGLSKDALGPRATFDGCIVDQPGLYVLRATASENLTPAEVSFTALVFRGVGPVVAKDSIGPAPKAVHVGANGFNLDWLPVPGGNFICGRIEKFREGVRVFYEFPYPARACDFSLPSALYPTHFSFSASLGNAPTEVADARLGDMYCFHLTYQAEGGGPNVPMGVPCAIVGPVPSP